MPHMHWITLGLLVACSTHAPAPEPSTTVPKTEVPRPKEGAVIEIIEETAVGSLDGIDVPMANVTNEYTFALPDGSQGKGKACMLILPDSDVWVGVGSEVKVGTSTWRVLKIHTPENETGSVTLEKVSP